MTYIPAAGHPLPAVALAIGVPVDTLYGWARTARAMGLPFSSRPAGRRMLSRHDAVAAAILAAFHRLGIGINPDIISRTVAAVDRSDPHVTISDGANARVVINAARLREAVLLKLDNHNV